MSTESESLTAPVAGDDADLSSRSISEAELSSDTDKMTDHDIQLWICM